MRYWIAATLATVGLLAAFVVAPERALLAYLGAYAFVASVLVGALTLAMIGRLTGAEWYRRGAGPPAEMLTATIPLLVPLFLPIAFGVSGLYTWAEVPDPAKGAFLSPLFFLVRSAVYLATWTALALLVPRAPRPVSAVGLPLVAFTMTFASFDWIMSLEPGWASAIFGVYVWSGGFLAALGLVVLLGSPSATLGKLLLTASIFWIYIAWSQALIVWIAQEPRETAWYAERTSGPWAPLALAFVLAKFVVPFLALLPYGLKRRRDVLVAVSALVLVGHALDVLWLVAPARAGTLAPLAPVAFVALVALTAFLVGAAVSRKEPALA